MGARAEEFKEDDIIIKEGEMKHRMYIVLEGKVVLYSNYGTPEEYVIGAYGKGKTFGEFNLFSTEPNMYTAVAFSDVKVAWFEKNNMISFINGYPDQALKMLENISKSYIALAKNLQLAIDEINSLKQIDQGEVEVSVEYQDIMSTLNQIVISGSSGYFD